MPKKGEKVSAQKLRAVKATRAVRTLEAFNYRKSGFSYHQIADKMGIAVSNAYTLVKEHLDLMREQAKESAKELIQIENERLDNMWAAIENRVTLGDDDAINSAIKIMNRRAALLGLDQPQKQEITGETTNKIFVYEDNGRSNKD